MSDIIVIDDTIVDQINKGNSQVASKLRAHREARKEIWITRENYRMLSRVPANERLLSDAGIRAPDKDATPPANWRGMFASHKNEHTAALANAKKARLITTDAGLAGTYRGLGGTTEPVNTAGVRSSGFNYALARELMGLSPIMLTPNGQMSKNAPGYVKTGSTVTPLIKGQPKHEVDGKPVVARPTPHRDGRTGSPIKPVTEHSLNPTPRTDAVRMSLRGVNWVIQGINDHIQQQKIEERMKQIWPTIESTLKNDPALGVLIETNFAKRKKMGAEHDSPLEHTKGFQYIDYEYGRTKDEAAAKLRRKPQMRPVGSGPNLEFMSQQQWIPPQVAPSAKDLPLPFPSSALATFYPGREELVAVSFSFAKGFDDRMKSVIKLNDPNQRARFIVMFPPAEVDFFDFGSWRKKGIQIWLESPKQVWNQDLTDYMVPVIRLDSFINPYDATAAMVYPADDYTMKLFEPKGRISDSGLLKKYSMDMIRFVKPQKMSVIENFNQIKLPGSS
jgi:hypothetical protein